MKHPLARIYVTVRVRGREGGGENAKFGLDFQHQSPLKRSGFKMTQCIRHLQHVTGAYIICLKMDSDITPFPNFYNVQNLAFEGV